MAKSERRFWLREHGEDTGPFTVAQLKDRYADGEIDGETLCIPRFCFFGGWEPLKEHFPDFQSKPRTAQDSVQHDDYTVDAEGVDVATTCPDCESEMRPIRLIVGGFSGESHKILLYTSAEAERSLIMKRYPEEGNVRARMCPSCGRVVLQAEPF